MKPTDKARLEVYQKAINSIDDFFEYRNESQSDRIYVRNILDNLTKQLQNIYLVANLAKCNVGEQIRVTKDIYDYGDEGHHPPGYIANKGDIVTILTIRKNDMEVHHKPNGVNGFLLNLDEFEKM